MSPLRTQKKRSPGRPKENKLIRELKVKTWFAAVAEASGKTAYELEKEFAPSYVDREEFGKHRARLWDKYRLGKTMPTIKERKGGRRPIALLVEDKYPGTLQWLISPIWNLADPSVLVTMEDLYGIYQSLESRIKSLLIEEELLNKPKVFWKKSYENHHDIVSQISKSIELGAFTAMLCLLRESILCQQQERYIMNLRYFSNFPKPKHLTNSNIYCLAKMIATEF
jgi:hypothetical protein